MMEHTWNGGKRKMLTIEILAYMHDEGSWPRMKWARRRMAHFMSYNQSMKLCQDIVSKYTQVSAIAYRWRSYWYWSHFIKITKILISMLIAKIVVLTRLSVVTAFCNRVRDLRSVSPDGISKYFLIELFKFRRHLARNYHSFLFFSISLPFHHRVNAHQQSETARPSYH